MSTEEKTPRVTKARIDRKYDGTLPVAMFCGLLGMLLGPLPAVAGTLILGRVFYPLFAAIPLTIYLLVRRLKAGRDIRAVIVIAVFSLLGAYFAALSCQAALYVRLYNMSVFSVPLVTILSLGKPGVLPDSASAYAYPLLFSALGVAAARELLCRDDRECAGDEG